MRLLLDASALLPLTLQSGKQLIVEASQADLFTIDLGIYETCNGLWKMTTLLRSVTLESAMEAATTLHQLTEQNLIQILSFASIDLAETLRIAQNAKLTFYDAAYITAAQKLKATLVSGDKNLCKAAANNSVKTISFVQLQAELAKNP